MVVAMGFGAEISGVAVGWWKGVGLLLWVMWVHGGEGGGCRGDGGGRVAVRFLGCCEVFVRFVEES